MRLLYKFAEIVDPELVLGILRHISNSLAVIWLLLRQAVAPIVVYVFECVSRYLNGGSNDGKHQVNDKPNVLLLISGHASHLVYRPGKVSVEPLALQYVESLECAALYCQI